MIVGVKPAWWTSIGPAKSQFSAWTSANRTGVRDVIANQDADFPRQDVDPDVVVVCMWRNEPPWRNRLLDDAHDAIGMLGTNLDDYFKVAWK